MLYVKANPKTVGINLSSITDTINGISNIALTVSGNISASGYVYPFPEYVTRFTGASSRYETAYTYVTSTSSAINSFIINNKPKYDSAVKYVTDGNIDTFSAVTIPYYNQYLIAANTYSDRIPQINNYISLCGNVLDIDNLFVSNSSKYEETYNYINNLNNSSKQTISHFFGHNIVLQSQKVNIVVQDNIEIQSWGLYANELPTNIIYNVKYIDSGSYFAGVLTTDGSVYLWGKNDKGQLGDGTITSRYAPYKVNIPPVSKLAIGHYHVLAVGLDGTLSAWGDNTYGQIGDGTTNQRNSPVKIDLPSVSSVYAGFGHSSVIGLAGTLSAWGANNYGQIGDNSTNQRNSPVKINLPPVSAIVNAENTSYALGINGQLSAWGNNSVGQIGDGTTTQRNSAVKINLPVINQIVAEYGNAFAIDANGGLSGWGYNYYGELGDGSNSQRNLPVKINVPQIKTCSMGFGHSLLLGTNNILSATGANNYGQLGDLTTTQVNRPIKINIPNISVVNAGLNVSYAILNDSSVIAWGINTDGQLGDGTIISKNYPVTLYIPATQTLTYNLSVNLLSSTYGNFGKAGYPVSITKGNPPYLTTSNKNSATNLDASWLGTTLPKGSILQFELINTNNSPVSGLLINLTTIKQ